MKINAAGIGLIKQFEGCQLSAYYCPSGILTIGFGHTGDVKFGQRITQHQADVILDYDLERFEEIVSKAVKTPLTENQFSALVSFVFNVGPGKKDVRDGFVTLKSGRPSLMLTLLNVGNSSGAADQFLRWNKGGGKVLPGLVKRRAAERALFLQA